MLLTTSVLIACSSVFIPSNSVVGVDLSSYLRSDEMSVRRADRISVFTLSMSVCFEDEGVSLGLLAILLPVYVNCRRFFFFGLKIDKNM